MVAGVGIGALNHCHLKRLVSIKIDHPCYLVTTCVAGRKPLLASPASHEILRREWSDMRRRHGWSVGRYVVMPDHVHFFITPDVGRCRSLATAVGKWKEWTAKSVLASVGGTAPLWQPEFFDHLIRSRDSMAAKWDYVRWNPVRAGLVTTPGMWPYAGSIDFE